MPALRPAASALGPRGALPPGGNGSDAAPELSGEGQQRPRAAVWRHCAQQCAPLRLCSGLWAPGVAGFGSQRVVLLSPPPSALAAPEAAAASVRSRWVRAARGPHGCARLLGRRRSLRPGTPSRPVCGSARNSLGLPSAALPSAFGIEEIYFPGAIFSDDTAVKPIVPALTAPHRAALLRRTDGRCAQHEAVPPARPSPGAPLPFGGCAASQPWELRCRLCQPKGSWGPVDSLSQGLSRSYLFPDGREALCCFWDNLCFSVEREVALVLLGVTKCSSSPCRLLSKRVSCNTRFVLVSSGCRSAQS